jgi:hypothetical protein
MSTYNTVAAPIEFLFVTLSLFPFFVKAFKLKKIDKK